MTIFVFSYRHTWILILFLTSTLLFLYASLSAFIFKPEKNEAADSVKQLFLNDLKILVFHTKGFAEDLELINEKESALEEVHKSFLQLKRYYKRIEYFTEYVDPHLAKKLNGPPIPQVVVENQHYLRTHFKNPSFVSIPPEGLQAMEELLFDEKVSPEDIKEILSLLSRFEENLASFSNSLSHQTFTDLQIIESLREQLIRVMTMGITGFDTPVISQSLYYSGISLEAVVDVLEIYRNIFSGRIDRQIIEAISCIQNGVTYLHENNDFDSFDRMHFIRELADPAYGSLTRLQQLLRDSRYPGILSFHKPVNDAPLSIFDERFLNSGYYNKQDKDQPRESLILLGRLLFFDPLLSSNNKRSCASCHQPSKAFSDGLSKSLAFDFKGNLQRNAPTLINSVLSSALFWDSRVEYLQDQVPDVVTRNEELHGSYDAVVPLLSKSKEYAALFRNAFPELSRQQINNNTINRSIAAYVQSLVALNSPFDQFMKKETDHLNAEAVRGFNLFMGKAACGTCHFAPVFNGVVPPKYLETESEVLGVPFHPDFSNPVLDPDSGRASIIKAASLMHSFKTPTVRNVSFTAPYMHNGVFNSLEEVIDFYDIGGGVGMGLEVPNQTLPADSLLLSAQEKSDLIAFMNSLSDTTGTTQVPKRLPSFSKKNDLNQRKIGGEY